ncbi:hypothetical protein [Acrocarpospora sp. B8E8]|uniref:hypothetical protein n=1 Tax=Acrocarpospora sp. B8E8 TaxID=3153572 RepID=UPI00325CFE59
MISQRIARICELHGDDLAGFLAGTDAAVLLDRVVGVVRAGGSPGEDELDALDDALAALGVDAGTGGTRGFEPVPGLGGGHPVIEFWACPTGACDRRVWRAGEVCTLLERPMRVLRLTT